MIERHKLNRRTFFSGALTGFVTLASNSQSWGKESTNLQQIISTQGLKNNTSAVLIDLETNQILESHNLSLRLPMASVTKALTAVYGLETIGRNYKFQTEVKSDGHLKKDGTLDGNIYIVGGGDPSPAGAIGDPRSDTRDPRPRAGAVLPRALLVPGLGLHDSRRLDA